MADRVPQARPIRHATASNACRWEVVADRASLGPPIRHAEDGAGPARPYSCSAICGAARENTISPATNVISATAIGIRNPAGVPKIWPTPS